MKALITLLILIFTLPVSAGETLVLTDPQKKHSLGTSLEYLESDDSGLTLKQAMESPHWKKSLRELPNFGFADHIYWFRFTVRNTVTGFEKWCFVIEHSQYEVVDLYEGGDERTLKTALAQFPVPGYR